jgi:hypothetical protein
MLAIRSVCRKQGDARIKVISFVALDMFFSCNQTPSSIQHSAGTKGYWFNVKNIVFTTYEPVVLV